MMLSPHAGLSTDSFQLQNVGLVEFGISHKHVASVWIFPYQHSKLHRHCGGCL